MPIGLDLKTISASGGAQANNVTLTGIAGLTGYLTGFKVDGLGATAGSTVQITVTGSASVNTPTWNYTVPAGVTVAAPLLDVKFGEKGIAASAPNTSLVVNVPSLGAGNTNASVVAVGYYA